MRYASVSVGIVQYRASYYRESSMRLRFAASDAVAFHSFLEQSSLQRECESRHILMTDGDATEEGVSGAFAKLGGERIDVLIVYLSGHGEPGSGNGGWFCLADAEPAKCSLGGAQLDVLLNGIDAVQSLVIVDCCHAEAAFQPANYFSRLDGSRTRLFIASSRAHQRSWEDVSLGRSVFSEVLLKGCSSESHLQDAGGLIDVERALFPYLREQVVLLTAANKNGMVQEPVTGGVSALPLLLPSVRGSAFGRPLSLADTLRSRLRQILAGVAMAALAALMLVDMMAYHFVTDGNGAILVRTGLVSTAALLPQPLVGQIDTGYTLTQLDQRNSAFLTALSRGEVRGVSTHVDELGLKAWSGQLATALGSAARAGHDIMVRGRPAQFDPSWAGAPIDEARFLLSLDVNMSPKGLERLYAVDRSDPPGCTTDQARKIDFSSLNPSPKVASEEMIWMALRASVSAGEQLAAFNDLVALAAYRSLYQKESASIRYEAANMALALLILTAQATDQTVAKMQQQALSMLATHCRLHASLALALIAPDTKNEPGTRAEAVLASEIGQYDRATQGDLANNKQELAASALMLLAQRRELSKATLEVIAALVRSDGSEIGGGTFAQRLLLSLAEHQSLPETILEHIERRLQKTPKDGSTFEKLGIVRVLSRNARFLSAGRWSELKRLLIEMRETGHAFDDFREALGFAGLAGLETGRSAEMLGLQLSPATLFAVPATTYRGDMLISANGDAAAIALGRIAQRQEVDVSVQERLGRLAAVRAGLSKREALVAGLAYQRYGRNGLSSDTIYEYVASAEADARMRALEVELACTALLELAKPARQDLLKRLLERWMREPAPELRYALALIIGRANFPAIGQLNLCRGLPELVLD